MRGRTSPLIWLVLHVRFERKIIRPIKIVVPKLAQKPNYSEN